MTSIRRLLGLFVTIALMAFALPTFAAQPSKIFGLTMDTVPSGNFVAGTDNTISARYTNLTPTGNSTINWVYLTLPKTLWTDGPGAPVTPIITFPEGGAVYSIDTSSATTVTIVVNNIPGIGSGGASWHFEIRVFVPATPSCGNYKFSAQAFTGNSGTQGQPFAYQATFAGPPPFTSKDSIAVVTSCSVKFDTQPTSATAGTTITGTPYTPSGTPVKVGVYDGASLATGFTGPVSLAITPSTGTVGAVLSGGGSVNAVAGVATFPSLSINTAGQDYQLRAGIGGPTVDSNKFWITGVSGIVDCTDGTNYAKSPHGNVDPAQTYVDFLSSDPGDWGVRRGPNSHDGTNANCQKVGVSVTFNGAVVEFLYDKSIPNQVANFKYWIIWPETTVNADNTLETSWDATYGLSSTARFGEKRPLISYVKDINGDPVYVPALNCSSDDLNQTSAVLMPKNPNKEPFITLGATYPDYAPDAEAKACLAQHVMIGSGTDGAGTFFAIYADKLVDRVDTWVRQP